jgi:hypothetical protein
MAILTKRGRGWRLVWQTLDGAPHERLFRTRREADDYYRTLGAHKNPAPHLKDFAPILPKTDKFTRGRLRLVK